jgi:uncharacterized protein (TIGR02001 family)
MKFLTLALTSLILVGAAATAGAMGPVDVEANLGFFGKYVWRGQIATDGTVMQGDVNVGLAGLNVGVWGNMDMTDANERSGEFNEVDWTLGYSLSLPKISLSAGLISYKYPDFSDFNTSEVYVGAGLGVLLSPSLTFYQDIDEIKGGYWEASVSHGVEVSPGTKMELFGGVGLGSTSYIRGYFGIDPEDADPVVPGVTGDSSMTDYHVGAAVPFHPIPFLTITPSVVYSSLMGDAKDVTEAAGGDGNAFVWGLNGTFSF